MQILKLEYTKTNLHKISSTDYYHLKISKQKTKHTDLLRTPNKETWPSFMTHRRLSKELETTL